MYELIEPNAWAALRLPSDNIKVIQVVPNTTISLGKYGSFPSNLIIQRPYNVTFELEDKRPNESFHRLRVVPHNELYADIFAEEAAAASSQHGGDIADNGVPLLAEKDIEYSVVDGKGEVLARSSLEVMDDDARQTLTMEEIEDLKREGAAAGKDLITKLMLRHTALDLKTTFSLSKYKLLKTRKYIRRFVVLPYDPTLMGTYLLEDKDAGSKMLEMREEMIALLGCWANVHYGGKPELSLPYLEKSLDSIVQESWKTAEKETLPEAGRWLVVDDTGGLLVASMAEKMGILYPEKEEGEDDSHPAPSSVTNEANSRRHAGKDDGAANGQAKGEKEESHREDPENSMDVNSKFQASTEREKRKEPHEGAQLAEIADASQDNSKAEDQGLPHKAEHPHRPRLSKRPHDFHVPFSKVNTITLIHPNSQANLSYLRQYGYDSTNPNHPPHPLLAHLLTLTWLQLLSPEHDTVYSSPPPIATPEEVMSWKANRRGNYHRKRRRWARTRHIVDTTRGGNFSGLVVASSMDPASVLRHTLPLLAGGAPVAVYSPTLEPLTRLADCYSVARRGAWMAGGDPHDAAEDEDGGGGGDAMAEGSATPSATAANDACGGGGGPRKAVRTEGTDEFPLNPTLLLGVAVQTSRVRKWQVLPNRTHPVMTSRGGAEGYILTGWRAVPVEGRIEARGKFLKRQKRVD